MTLKTPFRGLALALASIIGLTTPAVLAADEWEENNNHYYEDDAWYDITEWFDGNDYNPTDEAFFRWDDETYDAEDDTGADFDSDNAFNPPNNYDYDGDYDYDYDSTYEPWYSDNDYGFDRQYDNDNWFYDYYDDGYTSYHDEDNDDLFEFQYRFYDYDKDGLYDAYSSYSDWDGDGSFDDYNYYSFNDAANSQEQEKQSKQQSSTDSKRRSVTGEIVKLKKASVGDTKNRIVQLKKESGQKCFVDLGPVSQLDDFDLSEGDKITVRGAVAKVGDKKVVLAQHLKANGESTKIKRDRRTLKGEIDSMRTLTIRDRDHQLLVINKGDKKRLVDLGPAANLDLDLQQGDSVTVSGPAVKVENQRILMAQTLKYDGEEITVDRRSSDEGDAQSRQQARRQQSQRQQAKRQRSVTGEITDTRTVTALSEKTRN